MTCRVARSFPHRIPMEPVSCCECGATHMEVLLTSGTLGPHLCPICAQSMVEGRAWTKDEIRVPMRVQPVA